MGSVSIDIHKKEREYKHVNLSDDDTIKYLISYRSKLDKSYGAYSNSEINQAGDNFDFNQEIIVLYASLDKLVERTVLTKKQNKLLHMLYEGHSIPDIAELTETDDDAMYQMLNRLAKRIADTNNDLWHYTMGHKGKLLNKKEGCLDENYNSKND
ncbi:hypothetical protein pW2_119 [Bacillus phage pW2]|uniref:Uncharacterized protein n=1 Tax=Bacillus phage pW2 TaxID=2500559 RepID=A0A3Q9R7K5_9CAUD|nr:hypothetical protein PQE69_gp167 [Bacillus phage pW2]AZU98951.1 hypothetical protein pW2_119 [Bacillus phage pW2]